MQHAISFCQEHDDPELWENLIDNCLEKPGNSNNFIYIFLWFNQLSSLLAYFFMVAIEKEIHNHPLSKYFCTFVLIIYCFNGTQTTFEKFINSIH